MPPRQIASLTGIGGSPSATVAAGQALRVGAGAKDLDSLDVQGTLLTPLGGLSRFSDLGAVPEPATLALLAAGGMIALARRRARR